jgi:TPR repeat protein
MFDNGRGVPQDYTEAVKWFRKAAGHGYAAAQLSLGAMYDDGQGVPRDHAAAVRWYRKAADRGYADAQAILGTIYEDGQGVPQDFVQAHKWYNLAAARSPPSKTELRVMSVRARDRIAGKMTPAQLAEAQRLAREWKPE